MAQQNDDSSWLPSFFARSYNRMNILFPVSVKVARLDMIDLQFYLVSLAAPAYHAPVLVALENFLALLRREIFKRSLSDRVGIVPIDAFANFDKKAALMEIPDRTPRIPGLSSIEVEIPVFDVIDHGAVTQVYVGVIHEVLLYEVGNSCSLRRHGAHSKFLCSTAASCFRRPIEISQ